MRIILYACIVYYDTREIVAQDSRSSPRGCHIGALERCRRWQLALDIYRKLPEVVGSRYALNPSTAVDPRPPSARNSPPLLLSQARATARAKTRYCLLRLLRVYTRGMYVYAQERNGQKRNGYSVLTECR